MGVITIEVGGSFMQSPTVLCRQPVRFSAMHGGHAQAVGEAIKWLSETMLPISIQLDHMLHSQGEKPEIGFGKKEE